MKKFIIQLVACGLVCLIGFVIVLTLADGYTDPFYVRFTSPRQSNLILGTSRAAQGLQPEIFDRQLGTTFFNWSFTIGHSPFGPVYLESIKRKLDPQTKDGVFVIAIDPWSIASNARNPNQPSGFGEKNLCLGNTTIVDANPNFQYLIENFRGQYYHILLTKFTSPKTMFVHDDGWLEVNVPMDSITVAKRRNEGLKTYRTKRMRDLGYSTLRAEYLLQTVQYLKKFGKVYLVRLPIRREMADIEREFMPDFNDKVRDAVAEANGYYDMSDLNGQFSFTDMHHLQKDAGKIVSEKIARWIHDNN